MKKHTDNLNLIRHIGLIYVPGLASDKSSLHPDSVQRIARSWHAPIKRMKVSAEYIAQVHARAVNNGRSASFIGHYGRI